MPTLRDDGGSVSCCSEDLMGKREEAGTIKVQGGKDWRVSGVSIRTIQQLRKEAVVGELKPIPFSGGFMTIITLGQGSMDSHSRLVANTLQIAYKKISRILLDLLLSKL